MPTCIRNKRRVIGAAPIALFVFSFVFTGRAQMESGSLTGVVVDRSGASVPSASVKLKRLNVTEETTMKEVVTDNNGVFVITKINPGKYLLSASFPVLGPEVERIVSIKSKTQPEVRIELGKGCGNVLDELGKLVDVRASKREVVRLALAEALNRLVAPIEVERELIVSSKNIEKEWIVGVVEAKKITFLNDRQIQARADRQGDFLYVSFPQVDVIGTCIAVSVDYSWAQGRNSQILHMDGGGVTYEFRKEGRQWVGRYVSSWVS